MTHTDTAHRKAHFPKPDCTVLCSASNGVASRRLISISNSYANLASFLHFIEIGSRSKQAHVGGSNEQAYGGANELTDGSIFPYCFGGTGSGYGTQPGYMQDVTRTVVWLAG